MLVYNLSQDGNQPREAFRKCPMMPSLQHQNPLSGLITDEVFAVLEEHNLLSEKAIRDYHIRQQFRTMRRDGVPAYEAIDQLREQYAYLQFDTIRKIVYGLGKR